MARVVIERLTRAFDGPDGRVVPAVTDFSLVVEDKELLVLTGPSGCGKTTTLRLLAGLDTPDSGSVFIGGKAMNGVPPRDREVGMVFQSQALYPHFTAYENLAFGLKVRRLARAEIEARVREAADLLDITDCLDRKPGELSGGQRQRVALGRMLVRRPAVCLFDEPLSNVDAALRAQLRTELAQLHRRLGSTIIYVTHDQTEAMTLGNRIAVMHQGTLQQTGAPMEVYGRPANLFVAGFVGSPPMNFFRGALAQNSGSLVFETPISGHPSGQKSRAFRLDQRTASRLSGSVGKPVVLGLRPEHIVPRDNPETGELMETTVVSAEPLGPETYLRLAAAGHSFVARVPAGVSAQPRQKLLVSFDLGHAHFFDAATGKSLLTA